MQITQLTLPFSKFANQSRTMNNRGMTKRRDSESAAVEPVQTSAAIAESTRTSERRRGTFASRESTAAHLTPKESAQKLRNKALRLLTTREHSREELMQKLVRAKARVAFRNATEKTREDAQQQKDDIGRLVDDLAAQGWQSDDRYAEAMVRRLSGQASKRFITEKLAQAGIKKEAAQLAVEAIEIDDRDAAAALWSRRFGNAPRDDRERQRHVRFLLSRGFHLSDAFKIVPKVLAVSDNAD
jgi:regulatory protein